jgi:HEPN domain-containing protein
MANEMVSKWLQQALHDLAMAEKNISIGGYDVSAFLAQQAVEKLMKASSSSRRNSYRKLII